MTSIRVLIKCKDEYIIRCRNLLKLRFDVEIIYKIRYALQMNKIANTKVLLILTFPFLRIETK